MISTTAMILMGKVYKNLMVDLEALSKKLKERAKRIIMITTGVDYEEAEKYLKLAKGKVKTAIVMILGKVDRERAEEVLNEAEGHVRRALEILSK